MEPEEYSYVLKSRGWKPLHSNGGAMVFIAHLLKQRGDADADIAEQLDAVAGYVAEITGSAGSQQEIDFQKEEILDAIFLALALMNPKNKEFSRNDRSKKQKLVLEANKSEGELMLLESIYLCINPAGSLLDENVHMARAKEEYLRIRGALDSEQKKNFAENLRKALKAKRKTIARHFGGIIEGTAYKFYDRASGGGRDSKGRQGIKYKPCLEPLKQTEPSSKSCGW